MHKLISGLGTKGAFPPETITILANALDEAWETLQGSGAPFAAEDYAAATRKILAQRIMEVAEGGERGGSETPFEALCQLADIVNVLERWENSSRGGQNRTRHGV